MPVQVPVIDRFKPQDSAPAPRTEVNVPDFARATAPQAQAAEHLAETGVNAYERQVQLAADTKALEAANEFHRFMEEGLSGKDGVKYKKGDPTELYQQYDESVDKKAQEIRDRYKDAPSETVAAIENKLRETSARFYDRRTTAQGIQLATYRKGVADDSVSLEQNNLMDATAHLDRNDPKTFDGLETSLSKIYDIRVKQGLQDGSVKELFNEKGEHVGYDLNPSVKYQLAKDRSDGLYQAIDNLAKSGDVEGA
ncbi:MAG: hypothetical protein ACKOX6_16905, partial [Bdellovibrio sp.]